MASRILSYFFSLGSSLVSRGGRLKVPVCIRAGENLFLSFSVFEASLVFATTVSAKVTAQNGANWAGATPLFRLSAAQKVRGVAPAHMFARSEPFGEGGQPCC